MCCFPSKAFNRYLLLKILQKSTPLTLQNRKPWLSTCHRRSKSRHRISHRKLKLIWPMQTSQKKMYKIAAISKNKLTQHLLRPYLDMIILSRQLSISHCLTGLRLSRVISKSPTKTKRNHYLKHLNKLLKSGYLLRLTLHQLRIPLLRLPKKSSLSHYLKTPPLIHSV